MKQSFKGKRIATKIVTSGRTVSNKLGKNYPSKMSNRSRG